MIARTRHPSDRGEKTSCSICKRGFEAVVENDDGTLRFYWCSKCDKVSGQKK